MPKLVQLSTGLKFRSISAGVAYFSELLASQEFNVPFTGEAEVHIRAAYEEYCAKTDWRPSSPAATFYPTYDRGPGYTTRCYGVKFDDGMTGNFSMHKAMRAIAT